MLLIILTSIILLLLTLVMISLCLYISKKKMFDKEKNSSFECGFDLKSNARLPFSLHFFLITLIFLIFDVEITLILPMIFTFNMCNTYLWFFISLYFFFILLMSLYYEWIQGMLLWSY
uniref:NADH-ubiquinone oxidoreductase chain 3 n=1 Tax=Anisocentropus maculatus TaxID=2904904 RepID=A0A9E8LNP0_9NEOP|nr:NADH dehydrogenase subunit 3 [Anisocentropus maculatus]UZZ43759.1 NADH dehydrogenase subunit 3 [Anisocentropus maculatus]